MALQRLLYDTWLGYVQCLSSILNSSIKFLHQSSLVNFAGFHRRFLFSKVMLKIMQMLIVYNIEKNVKKLRTAISSNAIELP